MVETVIPPGRVLASSVRFFAIVRFRRSYQGPLPTRVIALTFDVVRKARQVRQFPGRLSSATCVQSLSAPVKPSAVPYRKSPPQPLVLPLNACANLNMRARLATKKLKQLLSPAVQVALEIGVAPAQTPEPPAVEEPPTLELPALPPVLEPPVPPLIVVPLPAVPPPGWPPVLAVTPPLPGRPATPVAPPLPIAEPPVLDAPAAGAAAPAVPPLASEPESLPPQAVTSSVTAIQPLTKNAALVLVAIQSLLSVELMEFYKAF